MEHEMSLDMLGSAVVSSGRQLKKYLLRYQKYLCAGMTAVLPSSMGPDCVSSPVAHHVSSLHPAGMSMYQVAVYIIWNIKNI